MPKTLSSKVGAFDSICVDSRESLESLESGESLRESQNECESQNGQNSYTFRICFALLLAFCLCALSTIQFPGLPYRARLGDSLILIAAICVLWDRFVNFALIQKGIIALCAAYALFVGFCYVEYRVKWQNMVAFIEAQKAQGEREIEVENIFHSRYKNFMNWGNPGKNADEWPNPTYAQYFGIEKFRVK